MNPLKIMGQNARKYAEENVAREQAVQKYIDNQRDGTEQMKVNPGFFINKFIK